MAHWSFLKPHPPGSSSCRPGSARKTSQHEVIRASSFQLLLNANRISRSGSYSCGDKTLGPPIFAFFHTHQVVSIPGRLFVVDGGRQSESGGGVTGNPSMPVESQSLPAMLYSHRKARSVSCAGTQAQMHNSACRLGIRIRPGESPLDFLQGATTHWLLLPQLRSVMT